METSDEAFPPTLTLLALIPMYPYPKFSTVLVTTLLPDSTGSFADKSAGPPFSRLISATASWLKLGSVTSNVPATTPGILSASSVSLNCMYLTFGAPL